MSLYEIPLKPNGSPFFEVSVIITNTKYYLTFKFNYRAQAWYMDISDVNKELIVAGARLRERVPPLLNYEDERLPAVYLFIVNLEDDKTDPDFESLGTKHLLMFDDEVEYVR